MSFDSSTVVSELLGLFEDGPGYIPPKDGPPKDKSELHPEVVKSLKKLHGIQSGLVNGEHTDYGSLHKEAKKAIGLAKKHGHLDIVGDLQSLRKTAIKHQGGAKKSAPKDDLKLAADSPPAIKPEPAPEKPEPEKPAPEKLPSKPIRKSYDDPKLSRGNLAPDDVDTASKLKADPKFDFGSGAEVKKSGHEPDNVDVDKKLKANPKFDFGSGAEVKKTSLDSEPNDIEKELSKEKKALSNIVNKQPPPKDGGVDATVTDLQHAFDHDAGYHKSATGHSYDPTATKAAAQKALPATVHSNNPAKTSGGFRAGTAPPEKPVRPVYSPAKPKKPVRI